MVKKKVSKPIVSKPDEVSKAHETEKDRPRFKTSSFGKSVAQKAAEETVKNAKKGKR